MPIRLLASFILVLVFGYGFVKAWPLLRGPEIQLSSPTKSQTTPDGFITISGKALHTQALALNGGTLLIDEQGNFSTTVLLPTGGSILTLTATDRFGRSTSLRRNVLAH